MYIFLKGNISEGFTAYGPYATLDDACEAHEFQEGWVMELQDKNNTNDNKVEYDV